MTKQVKCYGSTTGFHPVGAGPTPATRTTMALSSNGKMLVPQTGDASSILAKATTAHLTVAPSPTLRTSAVKFDS